MPLKGADSWADLRERHRKIMPIVEISNVRRASRWRFADRC
jgi:hypothetical protein